MIIFPCNHHYGFQVIEAWNAVKHVYRLRNLCGNLKISQQNADQPQKPPILYVGSTKDVICHLGVKTSLSGERTSLTPTYESI